MRARIPEINPRRSFAELHRCPCRRPRCRIGRTPHSPPPPSSSSSIASSTTCTLHSSLRAALSRDLSAWPLHSVTRHVLDASLHRAACRVGRDRLPLAFTTIRSIGSIRTRFHTHDRRTYTRSKWICKRCSNCTACRTSSLS